MKKKPTHLKVTQNQHKKVYIIYEHEYCEWGVQNVSACVLDKEKAEMLAKQWSEDSEIVFYEKDGRPIYRYGYYVQEYDLIT